VAGDSAGGNLAAEMCLLARDRNGPDINYQLLMYPITDCDFETASYVDNQAGFVLRRTDMQWFWEQYIKDVSARCDPMASPLRARAESLPQAHVITAEYDTLRDEGNAYAEKLHEAGVDVFHEEVQGVIHGFMQFAAVVDKGREHLESAGRRMGEALRA
jgi:acetyl esterase